MAQKYVLLSLQVVINKIYFPKFTVGLCQRFGAFLGGSISCAPSYDVITVSNHVVNYTKLTKRIFD